eukprot:g5362.t1
MKVIIFVDRESLLFHNYGVRQTDILDVPARTEVLLAVLDNIKSHHGVTLIDSQSIATEDEIKLCLSKAYLAYLKEKNALCKGKEFIFLDKDETTILAKDSVFWAKRAAGCVTSAVKTCFLNRNYVVAIARPPGHHNSCCEHLETEWCQDIEGKETNYLYGCHGGCLLPNISIAISALRKCNKVEKVAVIDIDAHFGDGTALQFCNDENVLCISLHWDQYSTGKYFPFLEGRPDEKMEDGKQVLSTTNLPLKSGSSDAEALSALNSASKQVSDFQPELIIIACGFDGLKEDSSSELCYSPHGYSQLVQCVLEMSDCPCTLVLEGGYNPNLVAKSFEMVLQTLIEKGREGNDK